VKISGLIKSSLIDYPGKITAVVFTQGCNLRCPFCHNPDLISIKGKEVYSEADFFTFLEKRKGLLDAATITGGEPLLHKDLGIFIEKIKKMGYFVKLDTNGTNPRFLKKLLETKNVDYVAMDIKNRLSKYYESSGLADTGNIKKSIKIIMDSGVDYEFRTTVLPKLHTEEDFDEIGKTIRGASKYFIQNFRPENTLDKAYQKEESFSGSELEKIKKTMSGYVKTCLIRENI